MQVQIRDAFIEDAPAICQVVRRSISECCFNDHNNDHELLSRWLANKTAENFASWIDKNGVIALVAVNPETVIGTILISVNELALCYVVSEALHQGVGKMLLQAAESKALAQGTDLMRLESTKTALPFDLRNGFSIAGPSSSWAGLESQPMVKELRVNNSFKLTPLRGAA